MEQHFAAGRIRLGSASRSATSCVFVRGGFFELDAPLASRYLDFGNPNSLGGSQYQWTNPGDTASFEPGEQGALLLRFGGPYSSISPSLKRPYSNQIDIGAESFSGALGKNHRTSLSTL